MNVYKFLDEKGVLHTYRWPEYPQKVIIVDDKELSLTWSESFSAAESPRSIPFGTVVVHCGPAAPKPDKPTADEFMNGLILWMMERGKSWPFP